MKLPKTKKMKNNASSAVREKNILKIIKNHEDGNDSMALLSKHNTMRNSFLNSPEQLSGSDASLCNSTQSYVQHPKGSKIISHQLLINKGVEKILSRSSFPSRFPLKMEFDETASNVIIQDSRDDLIPVPSSKAKMTKLYLKFWNRFITKQDIVTSSVLDHLLTENEAGYIPCQLKTLFESPESYVKKPYCQKIRYTGDGHQFLPSGNHFVKISSRSAAKYEVQRIFDYYVNPLNQYYLIPIELSSKLSRCTNRSNAICQQSQGCNKIKFTCKTQQDTHPLFAIEYRTSIDLETLPCASLSLVNYFRSDGTFQNHNIKNAFWNYPHLSHFLNRSDFWIDDFYGRCWHFSRYFSNKLDLGNRINNSMSILIKDSIFKFLISCSARICVAIKYWVLNPDGATYFRCHCGQKIYDTKHESKMVNKLRIGSAEFYKFQQKLKVQDTFHIKHCDQKPANHICACSQQFNDHKEWMAHIFSTKLSDIYKICPVFIYFFAQNCLQDNSYVCECTKVFSDYDFWSFWLHACGCSVLKRAVKSNCKCNNNSRVHKTVIQIKSSNGGIKHPKRTLLRTNLSRSHRSRSSLSVDNSDHKDLSDDSQSLSQPLQLRTDKKYENGSTDKYNREEDQQREDIHNQSVNVSEQNNFNDFLFQTTKRTRC